MVIDQFLKNSNGKTEKTFKKAKNSDRPLRSIVKSVSWRIVGTLDTIIISWIITGKVAMALTIGSIELLTKMVLYFFHERLWNIIKWGKQ